MAFPSLPSWSSRNPLSILALFIALIYGMAALLFGIAIKNLTESNQNILVWFLALFPVVVLAVFTVLVIYHHWKLYGPGEYRSDEGFYEGMRTNAPARFGARLEEAVDVAGGGDSPPSAQDSSQSTPAETAAPSPTLPTPPDAELITRPKSAAPSARQSARQMALFAETLAFQELQRELNGSVRRDVSFSKNGVTYSADGVIQTEQKAYVVEVGLVRVGGSVLRRVNGLLSNIKGISLPKIIALVVDEEFVDLASARQVAAAALIGHPDVHVRIWSLQELMQKYGLS